MSMIKAAGLSETSVHLLSWLKSGKEIFPFTENVHNGSGAQPISITDDRLVHSSFVRSDALHPPDPVSELGMSRVISPLARTS